MKQKKTLSSIFTYLVLFTLMVLSVNAAQLPVDLGTAGDYVILTKTGISTTGTTSIVGDIGVSPIDHTAITGFDLIGDETTDSFLTSALVTGKIYAANLVDPTPANIGTSISNMETAFTDAQGRTTDSSPEDTTELGAGDISGMTIVPGLHKWSSGLLINTGGSGDSDGITLDCSSDPDGVFIFQIAQNLIIGPGAQVTLIDCQASNVFWAVDGGIGVAIDTTAHVEGNILASKAITFNTGATLNGRALAQTAVTLDANAISLPVPATPVLTTITVSPTSANLSIESTQEVNATGFDQFGDSIDAIINFTSNNTAVATVSSLGLVTAVASGSATITASSGYIIAVSNITVETAAPVLNSIGSRSVTQGTELNFTITATSPDEFDLTYAINGESAAAIFTDNGDGTATFSWTPNTSDVGVFQVNFTVSDDTKSVSESVAITVNEFQAPSTTATNTGNSWRNADYNVTLNATGFNNTPIAYINYTLNGVAGQINASFGDVSINANGNNTLTFYAVDTSGNVETQQTIFALLDKITPNITSFTLSATSVNVGDGITGACVVTDNLDNSIVGVITDIDTTTAGTKTARCTATDVAGNVATADATYTVNTVPVSNGGGGGGSGGGRRSPSVSTKTTPLVIESANGTEITSPVLPSVDLGNRGQNNEVASADGDLITGKATGIFGDMGDAPLWWQRFIAWLSRIFGGNQ